MKKKVLLKTAYDQTEKKCFERPHTIKIEKKVFIKTAYDQNDRNNVFMKTAYNKKNVFIRRHTIKGKKMCL